MYATAKAIEPKNPCRNVVQ